MNEPLTSKHAPEITFVPTAKSVKQLRKDLQNLVKRVKILEEQLDPPTNSVMLSDGSMEKLGRHKEVPPQAHGYTVKRHTGKQQHSFFPATGYSIYEAAKAIALEFDFKHLSMLTKKAPNDFDIAMCILHEDGEMSRLTMGSIHLDTSSDSYISYLYPAVLSELPEEYVFMTVKKDSKLLEDN